MNLRNGDGGANGCVEEAGGADSVDGDTSERGGLGGRGSGVGRSGDRKSLPDAEGGRLPIADTNLDIVQSAGIAGGKREVERGILVRGDAGRSEAAAEEADGVGEQRALNEAGGDEREGDGDVA